MREEVHVLPWCDGTKYKNGKLRTKWAVVVLPEFNKTD